MALYNKYKDVIKQHKLQSIIDVSLFAIITIFFHYIWWHGLKEFLLNFGSFRETELFLANQVFLASSWIVEYVLQYKITTDHNTLYFPDVNGYVAVLGSCSGLKQFYQWTVLMILFPGPWLKKIWYIPVGLIIIHIVNIIRIVVLSIVVVHWPENWDFIHEWILRPFFYVVIFAMWVVWVEKMRGSG